MSNNGNRSTAKTRKPRSNTPVIIAALFACLSVLLGGLLLWQTLASASPASAGSAGTNAELEKQVASLQAELDAIRGQSPDAPELTSRILALQSELDDVIAQRDALTQSEKDSTDKLNAMQARLDAVEAEMKSITDAFLPKLNAVSGAIETLTETITSPYAPGSKLNGKTPFIAVYYEDLETGYSFAYRADEPITSASLIKLPFGLTVLRHAADGDPKYDLDRGYVYNAETDYVEGTGIIKYAVSGTSYKYRTLVQYMLRDSDCIAYQHMKAVYGTEDFRLLVQENGWKSMEKTLSDMSARDAGKIMIAAYDFMQGGGEYADLMHEALTSSTFNKLVGAVITDRTAARKYGWDTGALHEVALVYDTHPYVVAIMSDMDDATQAQTEYLRAVISAVDQLHRAYHESMTAAQ